MLGIARYPYQVVLRIGVFSLKEEFMKDPVRKISAGEQTNRRSFLRNGVVTAGAAAVGAGLVASPAAVFAQEGQEEKSGRIKMETPS
jgi:hypothetical protein